MSARPPVRVMLKDAVKALGGKTTHRKIIDWINGKYNDVNEGTVRAHINMSSVNMPGRVGMPENSKPREKIDERYDFLFSIGRGEVEFYDPTKHGKWSLMETRNGKTVIAKDGKPISDSSEESNSEFEKIKRFCLEELPSPKRNYREIAIKLMLEDSKFSATWKKIGDTVKLLNYEIGQWKEFKAGYEAQAEEMNKEYLTQGTDKIAMRDKETKSYSLFLSSTTPQEKIKELQKLTGHAIAKWHKKMKGDDFNLYYCSPGSSPSGHEFLPEFEKSSTIGCHYGVPDDLSNYTPKEVKNKYPESADNLCQLKSIKPGDIVICNKGKRGIYDFGIATSEYFFEVEKVGIKGTYPHRIKVEWLHVGPLLEEEHYYHAANQGCDIIDKHKDRFMSILLGEKEYEYFLLRYNGEDRDSPVEEQWKQDKLGERYHFGKTVGNHKKLRKAGVGTKTIWFKTKNLPTRYFWGYGSVKEVKTIQEDKEWNAVYDDFKYFEEHEDSVQEEGVFLKRENESIKQQIENLPGFSSQMSMLKITKKIYEEITGDRSTMSALTTQQNLDKFVRALNWKPNLILYGPPGTGKTWQAKRVAKLITENQNNSNDSEYSLSRYGKKLDDILDIKKPTWKMIAVKILLENNGTAINYHDISKLATEYRDTDGLTPHETIAKDIRDDIEKFGDDSFFTHPSDGMYGLKTPTTFAKAAEMILFAENKPMHFNEISKITLDKHIVSTEGVTPEKSLLAEITKSIQNDGAKSEFFRVDDGIYVLSSLVKNISHKNSLPYIEQVTFHQSFSYEEFIEGIKVNPTEDGTGVTYDVEPGIFREFCTHAQKDDKNNYVMIIDEINRGNIAKIFGELITIIENDKRGEPVTLAYSKQEFNVPENVFIIGTMNTADQSLTHLDAALKRRFTMIEIPPDSNVLEHSKVEGVDLTNLLDAINKKLVEHKFRDRRIGHSYFMSKDENSGQTGLITKIEDLQMAFATDIIPVLRDHFYDQEDILKDVLGNEFLDWENDQDLKEDWQEDKGIFKEILKKAFGV